MTAQSTATPALAQFPQNFRLAGPALGAGVLVLLILFNREVAAAIRVWVDSTAYNHCFLIIPIVAYLLWDRRALLLSATPVPTLWVGFAALPVMMVWLLAERLGIMEGRQLMMMTLVEILFLAVLGWRLSFKLAGPLLYLYFLVPFGAFLVPSLQTFTTRFIVHGLNLLNIPNYSDGTTIEIPEGSFLVAEACAGLRFLIASFAFGCLYALLVYRSLPRRILFIAISLIVPIIANGFRALGIVVLGHMLGSAKAATTDHILYGWIFFSVVILIQIGLGLPFRQDHQVWSALPSRPPPMRRPVRQTSIATQSRGGRGIRRRSLPWHQKLLEEAQRQWAALIDWILMPPETLTLRHVAAVAALPILLGAIGPAAASMLNRISGRDLPATLQPLTFAGACTSDPNAPLQSHDGLGRIWTQHLVCGPDKFLVQVEVFPSHTAPSRLIRELRRLSGEQNGEVSGVFYLATPEGPRTWRVVETSNPTAVTASSLWLNARPVQPGLTMRIQQALGSITGAPYAPIIVSLSPELDWSKPTLALRNHARDLISLFVQTYQSLPEQVARVSYAAAH